VRDEDLQFLISRFLKVLGVTMQLTRFTDYCLRVLMYLSYKEEHATSVELTTIAELAERYQISTNHLMKVVHHLAQLGYIDTVRGKGGGMRLAHKPSDINLAAVIADCEESKTIIECLSKDYSGGCPLLPQCELQKVLRDAQKAFMEHLKKFSLCDLILNRNVQKALQPLLFVEAKR
jgi:Rrf2 family nitric oxide-sensitive transcriptional repressor